MTDGLTNEVDQKSLNIQNIKDLRAEYKLLEQRLNALKIDVGQGGAGRYVSLALTETESSRHWLGEALGALDVESPYKE